MKIRIRSKLEEEAKFFSEALFRQKPWCFVQFRYEPFKKCSVPSETLRAKSTRGKRTFVFYGSSLISRSFMLIRAVQSRLKTHEFSFFTTFHRFFHSETTSIWIFASFPSILDLFWRFEKFFFSKKFSKKIFKIFFFCSKFFKKIFRSPSVASEMTVHWFSNFFLVISSQVKLFLEQTLPK